MNITITIPDEHLPALRQKAVGAQAPVDRPYAWAEIKFDPRTGQVLYTALRDAEVGDERYFALAASAQVEMGAPPQ